MGFCEILDIVIVFISSLCAIIKFWIIWGYEWILYDWSWMYRNVGDSFGELFTFVLEIDIECFLIVLSSDPILFILLYGNDLFC